MDKAMWDRWAAKVSGTLFVILFVIGYLMSGDRPDVGDSADSVVAYFTDNRGRILASVTILGLAGLAFVWWIATVAATLPRAGEARLASTAYGGGMVFAALFNLVILIYGAAAYTIAGTADAGVTKAVHDLTWPSTILIPLTVALFVSATSAASSRAAVLPKWFTSVGLVATVAFLLGGTTWASSGFWSPYGTYTLIIQFVFLAWVIVASWLLPQEGSTDVRAATTTPT
jgi:hypothetical protein